MSYPISLIGHIPSSLQPYWVKLSELQAKVQPIALKYIGLSGNAYLAVVGGIELYLNAKDDKAPSLFKLPKMKEVASERYYFIVHGVLGIIAGISGIACNLHSTQLVSIGYLNPIASVSCSVFFTLANCIAIHHFRKIYHFANTSSSSSPILQGKNQAIKFSTVLGLINSIFYLGQTAMCIVNRTEIGNKLAIFAVSIGTVKFFYDGLYTPSLNWAKIIN